MFHHVYGQFTGKLCFGNFWQQDGFDKDAPLPPLGWAEIPTLSENPKCAPPLKVYIENLRDNNTSWLHKGTHQVRIILIVWFRSFSKYLDI